MYLCMYISQNSEKRNLLVKRIGSWIMNHITHFLDPKSIFPKCKFKIINSDDISLYLSRGKWGGLNIKITKLCKLYRYTLKLKVMKIFLQSNIFFLIPTPYMQIIYLYVYIIKKYIYIYNNIIYINKLTAIT